MSEETTATDGFGNPVPGIPEVMEAHPFIKEIRFSWDRFTLTLGHVDDAAPAVLDVKLLDDSTRNVIGALTKNLIPLVTNAIKVDCGTIRRWVVDALDNCDYGALDDGIREVVIAIRRAGFLTTDSGDGLAKPMELMEIRAPHVAVVTSKESMLSEGDRLQCLLDGLEADAWQVEATYFPGSEKCVLLATKGAMV